MKGLIDWFSKNPVAGNALMALILVLGFANWFSLRKEIFPETALNIVTVQVPMPAASPAEIETGICILIEEEIADLDGIRRLTSTAAEGAGIVYVEVKNNYDTQQLMNDIRSRVSSISNFPKEAEEPVIETVLLKTQVLSLAISADTDEKTLRKIAEHVESKLLNYQAPPPETFSEKLQAFFAGPPKITQTNLVGIRDYEISIELSQEKLNEYHLSFQEVASILRAGSLDLPCGSVDTKGGKVLLRVSNKCYTAEEFANLELRSSQTGATVKLAEIATITDGFAEETIATTFNNKPTVLLDIYRVGEENTLDIANLVRKWIKEVAPQTLADEIELTVWNDTSSYLEGRLSLLGRNGLTGLLLVSLVLALFLRPSLAFLVALGIPVAFAGALLWMPVVDISINMISAFAFILVLGIVVDDAIVVGENVYSRIQKGEHPRLAAPRGTHEVGTIVIFGIITTMMTFTPMLMVGGVSGKIWPNIPWVVIPTLAFSLIQSKLVLPAHLALLKPHDPNRKVGLLSKIQRKFASGLEWFASSIYQPALKTCTSFRYVTISAFIGLFVISIGFIASGRIPFTFFPDVEGDILAAKLEMTAGSSAEKTAAAVARLEQAAWQLNEEFSDNDGNPVVINVLATTGIQVLPTGFGNDLPKGDNMGEVSIELSPAANRNVTSKEIISAWRNNTGAIAGTNELSFAETTGASGNAFDLEISAPSNEILQQATAAIEAELTQYRGVTDISNSNRLGKREASIELLPNAENLGLTLADVAQQVRQAFYGEEVQRIQRGRDEVKVMVRYPKETRVSLANLEQMDIRLPNGEFVPFATVATYSYTRGYATIQRANRSKAVTISADVDDTVEDAVDPNKMVTQFESTFLPKLTARFPELTWEFRGEQKDQADSVKDIGKGALLALLGIYILLAIPLKSYLQPFIVMSAIPFGLVGALVGHLLFGLSLSVMSMCGIVALSGVVVNDSLVLVDYINRHRKTGISFKEAVINSGKSRFRAVTLTSLTTFAGLIPMVTETDIQAKFLLPMAISLSFGILFATVITLILVPSLYLVLEDIKARLFTKATLAKMEEEFNYQHQSNSH